MVAVPASCRGGRRWWLRHGEGERGGKIRVRVLVV